MSQGPSAAPSGDLKIDVEGKNPWTNLRLNNDPREFRFAVISDRTGGHRPQVFSKAIERLNLLQPEFVVTVGDLPCWSSEPNYDQIVEGDELREKHINLESFWTPWKNVATKTLQR